MKSAQATVTAITMAKKQPWSPADATSNIRELARRDCAIHYKFHTMDKLMERNLSTLDAMHVLGNGYVYDDPQDSTRPDLFKYKIECQTPNSDARFVRLVVIPCTKTNSIKIVTVMWRD